LYSTWMPPRAGDCRDLSEMADLCLIKQGWKREGFDDHNILCCRLATIYKEVWSVGSSCKLS